MANTLLLGTMNNVEDSENQSRIAPTPLKSPDSERSQFFDLSPPISSSKDIKIEDLARRLFSSEHLLFILHNHALFQKFSNFITQFKPHLVPTLIRYLETIKAMKAIEYANAVAQKIRRPSSTSFCEVSKAQAAVLDVEFDHYSTQELALLVKEALPAWVAYNLTNVVLECLVNDMTGHRVPALQDLVGNLAEVFCLTDPSVHDNPIVYATEGKLHCIHMFYARLCPDDTGQNFIEPLNMGQDMQLTAIADSFKAQAQTKMLYFECQKLSPVDKKLTKFY